MGTILYHGSEYLIENPQFGKGSLHNDYGIFSAEGFTALKTSN